MVGESLVDLIRRPGEPELAQVGGSPLNVAVGLSRLDVPSALWTHFGSDEHGGVIADHLDVNGVAVVPGSVTSSPTSKAAAHIQEDGSARYEFDLEWQLEPVTGLKPVLVHTGSIATLLEPGAGTVRDVVRQLRGRATVSYDPNVRPQLMGERESAATRIESFIALTDVVKASSEDLEWLYPKQDAHDVALRWLQLGPAVVVVTQAEVGAFAVTTSVTRYVSARTVEVVDTIGAGDSFMSALIAVTLDWGLDLDRDDATALLQAAHAVAGITCSRRGADPPTREELPAGWPTR